MLTIRTVESLFISGGRTCEERERIPFKSYSFYAPEKFRDYGCIVNGRPLSQQAAQTCIPKDGEDITFINRQGEAFSWTTFWIIVGINILFTGVSIALSFLFGQPETPSTKYKTAYSWDGIQTTALAGIPIPLVYGEHRVGGNVIQAFTRSTEFGKSRLYMLVALCAGEIQSIGQYSADADNLDGSNELPYPEGLKINGKAASEFQGLKVSLRLGSLEQTALDGLAASATYGQSVDSKLIIDSVNSDADVAYPHSEWITVTNDQYEADSFEINLVWPSGIGKTNHNGEFKSINIDYEVQYKLNSASDWTSCGTLHIQNKKYRGTPSYTFGSYDFTNLPERGTYDIRIRQINLFNHVNGEIEDGGDSYFYSFTTVTSVNWLLEERIAYRGIAYIALEAMATEQLSGDLPQISTLLKGKKVYTYDSVAGWSTSATYSDLPPWVAADMCYDRRNGLGRYFDRDTGSAARPYRIDTDLLVEWAEWCEDNGITFNGVFDSLDDKAWDCVKKVCAVGHAQPSMPGSTFKPTVEKSRNPMQLFNIANVRNFKRHHLEIQDRPNVIGIQFLNRELDYERDEVQLEDPDRAATDPYLKESIQVFGITDPDQALQECRYHLNANREIQHGYEWETSIQAIACEVGGVVLVQHPLIKGVYGGKARTGSASTTLVLDQDITIPAGETWTLKVQHATDDSQETRTVSSAAGSYSAGDSLSVSLAWTATPAAGDVYILGEETLVTVPVLITKFSQSQDFTIKIEGIDYIDDLNDQTGTPSYPAGYGGTNGDGFNPIGTPYETPTTTATIETVQPDAVYAEVFMRDGEPVVELTIVASKPQPFYEIWTREKGETGWDYYAVTTRPEATITGLSTGTEYSISVVAIGENGARVEPDAGTKTTINTGEVSVAQSLEPSYPDSITVRQFTDVIRVSWERQDGVAYYELRRGDAEGWANARQVYVGDDCFCIVHDWAPTLSVSAVESWMLRSYDSNGNVSRTVASLKKLSRPVLEFPYAGTDYGAASWAGCTLTNVVDDGSGNIVLDTGQTTGTITTQIDLDESQSVHVQILMTADRVDNTTWDDAGFSWDSDEAKTRDWNGPLGTTTGKQWSAATETWDDLSAYTWDTLTVAAGTVDLEIRTSDDEITWSDWTDYSGEWLDVKHIQARDTLTKGNTLLEPRVKELQIATGTKYMGL